MRNYFNVANLIRIFIPFLVIYITYRITYLSDPFMQPPIAPSSITHNPSVYFTNLLLRSFLSNSFLGATILVTSGINFLINGMEYFYHCAATGIGCGSNYCVNLHWLYHSSLIIFTTLSAIDLTNLNNKFSLVYYNVILPFLLIYYFLGIFPLAFIIAFSGL